MIFLYLKRTILILAAVTACYGLSHQFGSTLALTIWAVLTAVACILGALLLFTSKLSRITWRNRLAGYLIPWGWRLNRGRLWPIPVISWVVWMAMGTATILLQTGHESEGLRMTLFAAWVIDASALVYLLGTIAEATPGSRVKTLWKLAVVIAFILIASVGFYLGGMALASLIVGGGPPLVVGVGLGLFLLILTTLGRNARWN